MKKTIIVVFGLLLLGVGLDAQYTSHYTDFEFGYQSMEPYLEGFNGRLYYWAHPAQGVYFIAVGHRIFIIPHYQFHRLRGFIKFQMLHLRDFIHYTCMGMSYYDNYLRFRFYKNYFNRYRYKRSKLRYIAKRYRRYIRKLRRTGRFKRFYRNRTFGRRGAFAGNNRKFSSRRVSRIGSRVTRMRNGRIRHRGKK
jgi:hypothetical protein